MLESQFPNAVFTYHEQVTEMICRIWHGWTTHANADTYERLLREEVFVGIHGRHIAGFHGIELLRRALVDEVEFSTMMGSTRSTPCGRLQAKIMKWLSYLRPHVLCCPTSTRDLRTSRCEFHAVRELSEAK